VNKNKIIEVRYSKTASPFAAIYSKIMMRKEIPSRE